MLYFVGSVYRHNTKGTHSNISRYPVLRLIKGRKANILSPVHYRAFLGDNKVISGHFYFIKDDFFMSLKNCNLMLNKDDENFRNGRPCHYCFENTDMFWMIPISSQVEKYRSIYNQKIKQRKIYDGIRFGFVNGQERAFLIQNCFPVTLQYIDNEYMLNHNTIPATVSKKFSKELNGLVRKVIRLYECGIKITLTDLQRIIDFIKN